MNPPAGPKHRGALPPSRNPHPLFFLSQILSSAWVLFSTGVQFLPSTRTSQVRATMTLESSRAKGSWQTAASWDPKFIRDLFFFPVCPLLCPQGWQGPVGRSNELGGATQASSGLSPHRLHQCQRSSQSPPSVSTSPSTLHPLQSRRSSCSIRAK